LFAIVIGVSFLIYIFPNPLTQERAEASANVLESLEQNQDFRNSLMLNTTECFDSDVIVSKYMPARFKYSYEFNIVNVSELGKIPEDLPADKQVNVESIFISGSNSEYKPMVVKLYYWDR
jgi:hypothetical protein